MNRTSLYDELGRTIGHTPLVPLRHLDVPNGNTIYCKHEFQNPSGSHYDRVYYRLYRHYELEEKKIRPGVTPIIENTSGCAGAACAYVGKKLGYETHIVVPGNLPENRISNILTYTPNLYRTHDPDYVLGTQRLLRDMLKEDHAKKPEDDFTRLFCLNHSQVIQSVEAMEACGWEVVSDLTGVNGGIDFFVSAVGNGISMAGISSVLKKKWRSRTIALDPVEAPVVKHLIEGVNDAFNGYRTHELYGIGAWGISFPFIDVSLIDDTYAVSPEEWEHALRLLIELEGLYVGHTSAASLSVALSLARTVKDKSILIILYDSLENY
ncbi:MAG: pyridoxal-phosphate dependent enzyme [Fidelibacterota bacterium]